MKIKKYYKTDGLVYGYLWGGGKGAYPASVVESSKRSDIEKQISSGIKDGSLDSGMGYESLIGGIFSIETISTINYKGKDYHQSDYKLVFKGKLNKQDKDFLLNCWTDNFH